MDAIALDFYLVGFAGIDGKLFRLLAVDIQTVASLPFQVKGKFLRGSGKLDHDSGSACGNGLGRNLPASRQENVFQQGMIHRTSEREGEKAKH